MRTGAHEGPPPKLVRRLIWMPLFLLATVALVASLPLWLLAAGFASRFVPGRWRPLRIAWFLFVYLMFDAVVVIGFFGLWIASGFGWKLDSPRFQDLHYRLAGWWLRRIVGSARRTFNLTFRSDDPTERPLRPAADVPILLLSRHAGPGDSILLVDAALDTIGRRPRIILKDFLQIEPVIDLALNRLPNHFIPSAGRAGPTTVTAIHDLCADMGADDCLILFPEGGNFTSRR